MGDDFLLLKEGRRKALTLSNGRAWSSGVMDSCSIVGMMRAVASIVMTINE